MLKFIIPAILIFFIVLFWEKIDQYLKKKLKIRANKIVIILVIIFLLVVLALLYF